MWAWTSAIIAGFVLHAAAARPQLVSEQASPFIPGSIHSARQPSSTDGLQLEYDVEISGHRQFVYLDTESLVTSVKCLPQSLMITGLSASRFQAAPIIVGR